MGASATFMFQSMGARSPCLLTRAEEPQLRIGLKQVPTYEFRLYNSDHTELLASVIVKRTTG